MPTVDLTRIGSNIGAMYSLQSLLDINNKLAAAQSKLSTGKRINSAADDPAGLVIATKMHTRSEGLKVAMDNISDAKNMLSVAESGLSKLTDIITQMRTKATQAASDTLGVTERATIQSQLSSFAEQIDSIINETKWNGVKLLDGSALKTFQTGVDEKETTTWQLSSKHDAATLNISTDVEAAKADATGNTRATAAVASGITSGLSELATGTYQFKVISAATNATTGSVVVSANSLSSGSGVTFTVTAADLASGSASELSNGTHKLTFVTGSAAGTGGSAGMTLQVLDNGTAIGGSFFVGGSSMTVAALKTAGSATVSLQNGSGSYIGVSIHMEGLTNAFSSGSIAADIGGSFSFDYIQKNTVKVQFANADGVAISVDADGSGSGTAAATSVYATASSTFDTGRGIKVTTADIATLAGGIDKTAENLTYTKVNKYSVDVSTAAKAGAYMTTLDTALDTVNSSMADLGSLMARMDIKAIVASSAQINVEAAYNRIMNANMAEEQVNASKYQVLQQTAVAMLAQSNQAPQAILSLFK